MTRILILSSITLFLTVIALPAQNEDKSAQLKQVLALQEVVQRVIELAEPAIACILVSRSDLYQRIDPSKAPPPNQPGKLGDLNLVALTGYLEKAVKTDGERDRLRKRLNLADPGHVPESFGSGIVIDQKGLILTNYHVVRDATKIFVRLPDHKGGYADIFAADPRSDLAVLKLVNANLTLQPLPLGDAAEGKRGQFVVALANPFAAGFFDGKPSASFGIISNIRRRAPSPPREADRTKTLHHYGTLLQTDVRLQLGCSGGALLDLKGKVIGLTSSLAGLHGGDTPGGFAIPMDEGIKRIIEVLKNGQEVEYGFLGVGFDPVQERGDGVVLGSVAEGSPADRIGLKPGHAILKVNGAPVHDGDELFLALGTQLAGSTVFLDVRKGTVINKEVAVPLAKFFVPGKKIATNLKPRPFFRGLRVDYTSVLVQQPERSIPKIPQGVLVVDVQSMSPAAKATLKPWDVITRVNGKVVDSPASFYSQVQDIPGELELTLAATNTSQEPPKVTLKKAS